jgi:inactivated superfamily I helicase
LLLEQRKREAGRRMRARAECAPWIDHDSVDAGGRLLPRRADPEAADYDAVVERAPVVLPALGDIVLGVDSEALAERMRTPLVGVDREPFGELLHALREEVEQLRELGLAACDDDASQRKALLIFFKKLSSGLYV